MFNGFSYFIMELFRSFSQTEQENIILQRVDCRNEDELFANTELKEELCLWASYRGQTLTKTVRGMMYYRKALEVQAFLDMAKDDDLLDGYKAVELSSEEYSKHERSLLAQCQAVVDMKFTYVVSCQQYGIQKRSGDKHAENILKLMTKYVTIIFFDITSKYLSYNFFIYLFLL
ncbi:1,3-beta-glucan synthase [Zostera marina]|uniref:1,3-beta-glucan synthase n=1 Tax=Zostera marina TaxID=29655 RepID=A0A0K9NVP3_ZOSMR|nr:1,3-beta-glucan synthase [Zostera marina]